MDNVYHILQSGTFLARYCCVHAERVQGECSHTAGWIQGVELNGIYVDVPVTFLRLNGGQTPQVRYYFDLESCTMEERMHLLYHSKSGTLQCPSPKKAVTMNNHKHKYILFVDETSILHAIPILLALGRQGKQAEVHYLQKVRGESHKAFKRFTRSIDVPVRWLGVWDQSAISRTLENQTMEVQLIVICDMEMYHPLLTLSRGLGFAKDEIDGYPTGEARETVFCVGCYRLQKKTAEAEMECEHCGAPLLVSSHYSERMNAYLGYISV
ncbi:hypothetical protein SAMN05421868_102205 [Paenibacillus naphthalenovorans]|nr:hypothetical protein SAMN05421868_102205 [Paenibacillus naphthalenovorans]